MKHTWIKLAAFLLSLILMGGMLLSCLDASEQGGEGASEGDASQGTTGENQSPIGTTVNAPTVADFDPNKTYPLINYFDLDMSEYVQLGRYQNLSLTVASADISVTDAQVQAQMDGVLAEHHPNAKITDRAVQMGDTIVMDYVGKLDGVAFQGGTALSQTITVSENNSYIPGFVDGMVGLIPGEMTEVPVTFPENYGKAELNGQAVIFEMTVHYIVGTPVLDDAFVEEYTEGEMSTVEEYTASVRAEMEQAAYDAAVRNALWTRILANSAVTQYPTDAVMYYYGYYYVMYNQYAAMYGLDYNTFLNYSGMSAESIFSYCLSMVQQDLVRHAIYQAGGFACTEEQYRALLDEYTDANYEALRSSMIAAGESDYTWEQANDYFHTNYSNQLKDTCLDEIATKALVAGATVNVQ